MPKVAALLSPSQDDLATAPMPPLAQAWTLALSPLCPNVKFSSNSNSGSLSPWKTSAISSSDSSTLSPSKPCTTGAPRPGSPAMAGRAVSLQAKQMRRWVWLARSVDITPVTASRWKVVVGSQARTRRRGAEGRQHQDDVTPAFALRRLNGGADRMARGRCVMRVVCVSASFTCRLFYLPNGFHASFL